MSIDNIHTYYSGNDYGDFSNGTQSYTDYSVNEINGPCKVQFYTITDGKIVFPNGYTKFATYIVKNQDVNVDIKNISDVAIANGFDKNGQVLTITNSGESKYNINITYPNPTMPTKTQTATLRPTNAVQLFIMYEQGKPNIYSLGTIGGSTTNSYGGILQISAFSGSPLSTVVNAISGINLSTYAINVTGSDPRMWSVTVDTLNNTFTISSNSNSALTGPVYYSLINTVS